VGILILNHSSTMTTLLSPEDLLAAIPFLLGYHPDNSVVLLSLHNESIDLAMRVDFPDRIDLDEIELLAEHLVKNNARAAMVCAYTPEGNDGGEELLEAIRGACELRAIHIRESIIVHDGRWHSLINPAPARPLPDISESRIAVEQVVGGRQMPRANIEEVKSGISALPTPTSILNAIQEIPEIDYEGEEANSLQRAGARALLRLVRSGVEFFESDPEVIALILVRLRDLQVRDFAMGLLNEENIDSLGSTWLHLFRTAPTGYRAPIGCIYAQLCYERGDGGLAHRVLDRVLEDDSSYSLALLLRRAFAAGWPPSHFQTMRRELHPKITAAIFQE